jgi:hypothetical protein
VPWGTSNRTLRSGNQTGEFTPRFLYRLTVCHQTGSNPCCGPPQGHMHWDHTLYSRSEFELAQEPVDDPVERARRFLLRQRMSRTWGMVELFR